MDLWQRIKNWFSQNGHDFGELVTDYEHRVMTDLAPLAHQILATLEEDAYDVVRTELQAVITAALSGVNVGAAIADTIPTLIGKLESDGKTVEKNALYGVAAAMLATLPAPAVQPATS